MSNIMSNRHSYILSKRFCCEVHDVSRLDFGSKLDKTSIGGSNVRFFHSWIRDEDSDSRAWLKGLSVDLVFKCVMNACTCFDRLFACVSRLSLVWLQFGRGPSVESSLRTPRNISSGPCPKKNDLDCSLFQTRT